MTGPGARRDATELYRTLAPAVLGYLRAARAPDPEDLLGEVFLQVVRDLPRVKGDDAAVRRFVFTVAHNRIVDARRRVSRRPRLADGPVPDAPALPTGDTLGDPELSEALTRLTADQRAVVILRFVADLPIDVVAKLTGRSAGAVKSLQHRALETLGVHLRPPAAAGATTRAGGGPRLEPSRSG